MGWDYTRTPEGKIAIWSSICDDFIFEGTEEEAVELALEGYVDDYERKVRARIKEATLEDYLSHKRFRTYCDEHHEDKCALNMRVATEETRCTCSARPGKKLGEA
jgi:hypothetical protein